MATFTALAVAILSVAFGAAMVFVPRAAAKLLAVVRVAAVGAAVGVVVLKLVPDAYLGIGPVFLVPLVAAFLLPLAIERIGKARVKSATLLADEIAYGGLLAHSVMDGVALRAYADDLFVLISLAAHTVPIAALIALRFEALRSRTAGLLRAAGLAAATIAGVLLTAVIHEEAIEPIEPWIDAVVAGLLLHIALHSLSRHDHAHEHRH
jgi:hypothetical protein